MANNFTKLSIQAFSDEAYTQSVGSVYNTLINPENYNVDYKIELSNGNQAQGQDQANAVYVKTVPQNLNLDFLFDTTGSISNNDDVSNLSLNDQIQAFVNMAFDVNGELHQPNFLKIVWGDTLFKGRLENLNINYKLFDTDGKPIRAILKCSFRSSKPESNKGPLTIPSSPDLTHVRLVQSGDTLPLLCFSIYESSSYYLQVAQINGITNFRKLQVGTKIYFPPLSK